MIGWWLRSDRTRPVANLNSNAQWNSGQTLMKQWPDANATCDQTCLCNCSLADITRNSATRRWVSPVIGDQTHPVAKIPLWNLSVCNRMLGDSESDQVTGRGVRLHALGAVAAQQSLHVACTAWPDSVTRRILCDRTCNTPVLHMHLALQSYAWCIICIHNHMWSKV
jgi:hypothetical protein